MYAFIFLKICQHTCFPHFSHAEINITTRLISRSKGMTILSANTSFLTMGQKLSDFTERFTRESVFIRSQEYVFFSASYRRQISTKLNVHTCVVIIVITGLLQIPVSIIRIIVVVVILPSVISLTTV